jgi:hypothetical protein
MGNRSAPNYLGKAVHLTLRGQRPQALVQDEEDWNALARIAERMLFWCGGAIHGCCCEGNRMHFAVQVANASIGAMAQHISGAYSIHLRRRREWTDSLFSHYLVFAIDAEVRLDDLVIWLHAPEQNPAGHVQGHPYWTADAAYLSPGSLTWITTDRVLDALGHGSAALSAYRRRKTEPLDSNALADVTRPSGRRKAASSTAALSGDPNHDALSARPSIEMIAQAVAQYAQVSYADMRSSSRSRAVSRAKIITAVLCTRQGFSASTVAGFFKRSRSTLIEQAERLRVKQPQIFADAERALAWLFNL